MCENELSFIDGWLFAPYILFYMRFICELHKKINKYK